MQLSARPLVAVSGVNAFEYATEVTAAVGDVLDFYLQLTDLERHLPVTGIQPPGQRYVAAAGATLKVEFLNLDDAKKVSRFATQPFAGDASIWKTSLLATDPLRGTVSIRLTLTEGVVVRQVVVQGVMRFSATQDVC